MHTSTYFMVHLHIRLRSHEDASCKQDINFDPLDRSQSKSVTARTVALRIRGRSTVFTN